MTRVWQRNVTTSYTTTPAGEVDVVTYSVGVSPEIQTAPIRFGYDRLGRRDTIKTYLPGTVATSILGPTPPSPVSTLSQTYNDLGEPETESWSGRSVTTSRDSFGRRQGVTTSVAGFQPQNVTAYDPAGRPAIITAGSHTATYRYVANSRIRAGVTYRANGTQRLDTQYDFDRLNRLQQFLNQPSAAGQPAERHAYTYNAAQQRIRDELADGSSWNWEYDRLGQVIGGRKSWPDGSPVAGQQFEYGFDDIGNRVSQKRGGDANGANLRSTTYVVNPLNQITSRTVVGSRYLDLIGLAEPGTTVTAGGVTATRRGEFWRAELNLGNGNPLWQSVNITTSDGGSLANALYRVPPSSEVPAYDADGNLTADGLWTYTWDAENRLISMQSQALVPTAGRRKLDFEYDPLGRRIGRVVSTGASGIWVPTSTTRWLYEGWNPVAELNGAGTLVREYVWGTDLSGGWQGAGGVGGLLWVLESPTGANAVHYTAYDGNGNVMGLVNAADGTWSARYEYGPFGEVVRATGAMAAVNPFRWSTKIQDEDSGLNCYGYRYYSAGAGRWLGRDPIGERGGVNLSAFLGNSPIGLVDYLGKVRFGDDNWPPTRFPPPPGPITVSYEMDDSGFFERLQQPRRMIYISEGKFSGLVADIQQRTRDTGCCVEKLVITIHNGVPGALKIGVNAHKSDLVISKTTIETGEQLRGEIASLPVGRQRTQKENLLAVVIEAENNLEMLKAHLCHRAVVDFVSCSSGAGEDGKKLEAYLESLLGNEVDVILHEGKCRWTWGSYREE